MSVIGTMLDKLSARRSALVALESEIAKVAGQLHTDKISLEAEIKGLEAEIKSKARFVSDPHTLAGSELQLVWGERRSVNMDALDALFDEYHVPAAQRAQIVSSKGSWSIRARGKRSESGQAVFGLLLLLGVALILCVIAMNGSLADVGGFTGLFAKLTGFIPALP